MPGSAPGSAERVAGLVAPLAASGRPERARDETDDLERSPISGRRFPTFAGSCGAHLRAEQVDYDQLIELCVALWVEPVHERRLAVIEALGASPRLLPPSELPAIETWFGRIVTTLAHLLPPRA